MVLERNEREREARIAVEPELERDVERVLWGTLERLVGRVGLAAGTVVVAVLSTLNKEIRELGDIANHLGIARLLSRLLRELIPDLEPVTVVLVNALAANLELDVANKVVTDPVEPAELGTRAVRREKRNLRERGLEVDAVDEVTIALNGARHLAAEAGRPVEGVLN